MSDQDTTGPCRVSNDLKAELLRLLSHAPCAEDVGTWNRIYARLQSATIVEPERIPVDRCQSCGGHLPQPPPLDPCVVHWGRLKAKRFGFDWLNIEDDTTQLIQINRQAAAALIPALQAFVREGGA